VLGLPGGWLSLLGPLDGLLLLGFLNMLGLLLALLLGMSLLLGVDL
jgi:hypothetical protein